MKKSILIFGAISGALLCTNGLIMVNMCYANPGFESNDVLGYAALVLMFSLIFFGIRNYRNKFSGGYVTFGKAFKTGALIALLASTIYVVAWLFYYYLAVPDFIDQYTLHVLADATRKGATPAELAQTTQEMAQFKEMYKNPVFVVLITYVEVLPIGLVVALISALILRRKPKAQSVTR